MMVSGKGRNESRDVVSTRGRVRKSDGITLPRQENSSSGTVCRQEEEILEERSKGFENNFRRD